MQNQLNQIAEHTPAASHLLTGESADTPHLVPPETDRDSAAFHSAGVVARDKAMQLAAQASATETDVDDATRHHFEETHEYKFQIYKLKEKIQELESKNRRELALAHEKLSTYESHFKMLQEENARLQESAKL